jgi:RimJ/RimL family protein N-acetyltransferase
MDNNNCTNCNWFAAGHSPDPTVVGTCEFFEGNLNYDQAMKGCSNWTPISDCKRDEVQLKPPDQTVAEKAQQIRFSKQITLKNGKQIVIRTGSDKDRDKVWNTFSNQPKAFYRYIHGITKPMVENWYPKEQIDFKKSYPINCFEINDKGEEGDFIGNAMLLFHSPLSHRSHVAKFGFGIIPAFQGMGVGSILLSFALKMVKEIPVIKKIQTETVADNIPAIRTYLKAGFKIEGCRLKSWIIDDHYFDTYILGLIL